MKYLTEKEEKILLSTIREIKGKRADRDYTIIFLGLNTGLRCSEIIGLNVGDVRNREKVFVRPEIAKRAKARIDRKSTRLNSSHIPLSRMPSSA